MSNCKVCLDDFENANEIEDLNGFRCCSSDSNVYTIHPPKSDLVLFYEVVEPDGGNTWGGANAEHCIQWLSLAPSGSRVLVSAWDSDEEDAHLVGQTIDITEIVRAASL